jgi:hypothetical protein
MENQLVTSVVTVAMAIIGVAIIAVLVSKQANTTGVIQASSSGFSQALGTALSPVTGSTGQSSLGLSFGGANQMSYE